MESFNEFKKTYYQQNICVSAEGGVVFFGPDSQKNVIGAAKMTYDEYLDVQIASLGKTRTGFLNLYLNIPLEFNGQIERINSKRICFKRISLCGMFPDGETFIGHEDHVWMEKKEFENYPVGTSVKFFAEVYRYVKSGNGKLIDYGLRNPEGIEKISPYQLPTDEELVEQGIRQILCDTCILNEQCNRFLCMRSPKSLAQLKSQMKNMILDGEKK